MELTGTRIAPLAAQIEQLQTSRWSGFPVASKVTAPQWHEPRRMIIALVPAKRTYASSVPPPVGKTPPRRSQSPPEDTKVGDRGDGHMLEL